MREWTETMPDPEDKIEDGFVWFGLVDKGTTYTDPETGLKMAFTGEDGRNYIGLLDGNGHPLKHGEPLHIFWFKKRRAEEPS